MVHKGTDLNTVGREGTERALYALASGGGSLCDDVTAEPISRSEAERRSISDPLQATVRRCRPLQAAAGRCEEPREPREPRVSVSGSLRRDPVGFLPLRPLKVP